MWQDCPWPTRLGFSVLKASQMQDPPIHNCTLQDEAFVTVDGGCKDLATGLVWSRSGLGGNQNTNFDQATAAAAAATRAASTTGGCPRSRNGTAVIANGAATYFELAHPNNALTGFPFAEGHRLRLLDQPSEGHRSAWSVDINTANARRTPQT